MCSVLFDSGLINRQARPVQDPHRVNHFVGQYHLVLAENSQLSLAPLVSIDRKLVESRGNDQCVLVQELVAQDGPDLFETRIKKVNAEGVRVSEIEVGQQTTVELTNCKLDFVLVTRTIIEKVRYFT